MLRFVGLACLGSLALAVKCPNYADVADSSVSADRFTMEKIHGVWYTMATSEPTIPSFCKQCGGIANFTATSRSPGGDYRYTTTATCVIAEKKSNMSITIGGHTGSANSPGQCEENFAPFNKTIDSILVPNLFFHYDEAEGYYMSYACLGSVFGHELHSFSIFSRTPFRTREWVEDKVQKANATGLLDVSGLTVGDQNTYQDCFFQAEEAEIMV